MIQQNPEWENQLWLDVQKLQQRMSVLEHVMLQTKQYLHAIMAHYKIETCKHLTLSVPPEPDSVTLFNKSGDSRTFRSSVHVCLSCKKKIQVTQAVPP